MINNTFLKFFLLTAVLFCLPSLSVSASAAETAELSALIDAALTQNPALQAAKDQQLSAGYKVNPAGALADPIISFAFSNYPVDTFQPDVTPMTGNEIKLAQKVPFPGKRKAKKEIAAQDSLWFEGVYQDAMLELVRQVKAAYYKLYFIDRSLATVAGNLSLLDDLSRLAETRYRVGKGKQSDVLKIHLERTKQRDRLIQLEQKRDTVQGNLNRLANQSVDTEIQTPEQLQVEPLTLNLDDLQISADKNRPLFAAWQARVEKAKKQKRLAGLDYKPDLTLWAGYRFRDDNLPDTGTDFASAGISFNLPVNRSRRAAAVSASEASLNQAYNQFADFRNKVSFAIDDAFNASSRNYQLVELYRTGIVLQARQVYASAMSSYQVGQAEFPELLSALLALDKYETELHRMVSEYLQAVARLEAASGTPISVASIKVNPEN